MKRLSLWLVVVFLMLSAVACATPKIELPDRDVPISEEAAQRFESKLAQLQDTSNGDVKMTFTEEEVTSYVNLRLLEDDLPIQKPTIWFSEGKVYLKGHVEGEGLPVSGDAVLVVALTVHDGVLQVRVEKAVIGRFPVPDSVLDKLTHMTNERIKAEIGPIRIKELQILEGEAILVLSR